MGCMEGVLSNSVGWDIRRMAAQLMEWSDTALMDYGGKSGGGENEWRKACEGRKGGDSGRESRQTSWSRIDRGA
jgi:hypothetical protein